MSFLDNTGTSDYVSVVDNDQLIPNVTGEMHSMQWLDICFPVKKMLVVMGLLLVRTGLEPVSAAADMSPTSYKKKEGNLSDRLLSLRSSGDRKP